jgi:hypothetical protein
MPIDAVEATESLFKEAGLVGLHGPLDEFDKTLVSQRIMQKRLR